jgi:hypothetical protein
MTFDFETVVVSLLEQEKYRDAATLLTEFEDSMGPGDSVAAMNNPISSAVDRLIGEQRIDEAHPLAQGYLSLCRRLNDPVATARALANCTRVALELHEFDQALQQIREQQTIANDRGDLALYFRGLASEAMLHSICRNTTLMLDALEEQLRVVRKLDNPPDFESTLGKEVRQADQMLTSYADECRERNDREQLLTCLADHVRLYLAFGRPEAAVDIFNEMADEGEYDAMLAQYICDSLQRFAGLMIESGEPRESLEMSRALGKFAIRHNIGWAAVEALAAQGTALALLGMAREGLEKVRNAYSLACDIGMPPLADKMAQLVRHLDEDMGF